jgi:hypothetical protein
VIGAERPASCGRAIVLCHVQSADGQLIDLQRLEARFANLQAADGKAADRERADCRCAYGGSSEREYEQASRR